MKKVGIALIGLFAASLAPFASADELSDRFIAACVAAGDNPASCTCASSAMRSTLTEAQFTEITGSLEAGGLETASTLLDAIFVAQPELIEVYKTALSACN